MKADERMWKRMLEKDARKNTYKLYKPGEKLFIRSRRKGKDSLKKHRVLIGRILKRYKDDATYLVKVKFPGRQSRQFQNFGLKILLIIPNCLSKINQSKQKEKITKIIFVAP